MAGYEEQCWKPHFDGTWKAEGGTFKWLYDDGKRINMRRFDIKLLQVGLHGNVNSVGILVGVLAPGHASGGKMSLDRCWSHAHFNGRSWFADGSRGKDHNSAPTGGALYVGDTVLFPWATTKMPIFKQGDTIGVEINLGRQYSEQGKLGGQQWRQANPLADEDFNGPQGASNVPRIRFFHNGNLVNGNLL